MVLSALFITDRKGKILISRNYRGDIPIGVTEGFSKRIQQAEDDMKPVYTEDGVTFVYIQYNNLYLLGVTKRNSNALVIMLFLYKMCEVFREYFGDLQEESIRDNFVIIYELLDETMDHGYPQTTEADILKEYITQEGHRAEAAPKPPMALTNAVSWRSEGIKHKKNEIFLDVVEYRVECGTMEGLESFFAKRILCKCDQAVDMGVLFLFGIAVGKIAGGR